MGLPISGEPHHLPCDRRNLVVFLGVRLSWGTVYRRLRWGFVADEAMIDSSRIHPLGVRYYCQCKKLGSGYPFFLSCSVGVDVRAGVKRPSWNFTLHHNHSRYALTPSPHLYWRIVGGDRLGEICTSSLKRMFRLVVGRRKRACLDSGHAIYVCVIF